MVDFIEDKIYYSFWDDEDESGSEKIVGSIKELIS